MWSHWNFVIVTPLKVEINRSESQYKALHLWTTIWGFLSSIWFCSECKVRIYSQSCQWMFLWIFISTRRLFDVFDVFASSRQMHPADAHNALRERKWMQSQRMFLFIFFIFHIWYVCILTSGRQMHPADARHNALRSECKPSIDSREDDMSMDDSPPQLT